MLKSVTRRAAALGLGAASLFALTIGAAEAAPEIGAPAPAFTGTDSNGNSFTLGDLQGQKVILEWTNHQCPYVKKHYETENMQSTQAAADEAGYFWVSIISSAPGKQGHVSGAEANELTTSRGATPDVVLIDESGAIGQLYDAKTTPHMYIIDEAGLLRYMGAIDDKPTANHASVDGALNYVSQAMNELGAGNAVSMPVTQPYGCSVKY